MNALQPAAREDFCTRSDVRLQVEQRAEGRELLVELRAEGAPDCVLHWGLRSARQAGWQLPQPASWPEGTKPVGTNAAQTPFLNREGASRIVFNLSPDFSGIEFALFYPANGRWDNNGGKNYHIALTGKAEAPGQKGPSPQERLKSLIGQEEVCLQLSFDLNAAEQLAVAVTRESGAYRVRLASGVHGPLALHWGVAEKSPKQWLLPPEAVRPPGTTVLQIAAETPFEFKDNLNFLELRFEEATAPVGIQFVLKLPESGAWLKDHGQNFFAPIAPRAKNAGTDAGALSGLVDQIVAGEMGDHSWTLMHRFNLCFDLVDGAHGNLDALALLFVWLRFSAIRQLTWQRNYNTKPRELSHAEDRLTQKLVSLYGQEPASWPLLRLMLPTVGRGGDGQKVRDEILNIMHRHHIKEVSGHFLEEWHQKLHNNTTPDDIEICQAYLEFLRSDGNLELFYKTLLDGGVERKRLQSFERPIKSDPTFHAHLKGGLIPDFEYFLKILKSVHAGADLETALQAAKGQLDGEMQGLLASVWQKQNDARAPMLELVEQITKARRSLAQRLSSGQNVRDLLYLDLALEQSVRSAVEKNIHLRLSQEQLVQLFALVLENVILSPGDVSASEPDRAPSPEGEFAVCLKHWQRLKALPNREADWPLHAKSVLDRVARALARSIDSTYQLLQPKAELLGKSFEAEPWTITLFSEEVVRGQSLGFVLSMVLHHLEPLLRKAAHLGDWQIISRGQGRGIVEVVESLRAVQGKTYDRATIIIADAVMGDEEVPPGVTAVIAPDVTDIVSHVAVRARNAGLLFASCHDREVLQRLKSLRGRQLSLKLNPAGDVVFSEVAEEGPAAAVAPKLNRTLRQAKAGFTKYAVGLRDFTESVVGMKSLNQLRLQQQLSGRVPQPKSAALPFGVFEHVLSLEANRAVRERTEALLGKLKAQKSEAVAGILAEVRQALLGLSAPEELVAQLRAVLKEAGLAWPANWEQAWGRIKEVWASKWNERAYWSREAAGIAHEELRMAVLIQEVVEAEFAFVIHTANPISGQRDQLLAEVVFGLGETLVGNYPGRAFSFVAEKGSGKQSVLSYPSKSVGLYGSGLIFRSDSNGEDLVDYAGAGLYESVLLDPPKERILDYAAEPMLWDSELRAKLFKAISATGIEVEHAFGAPQDIEGAFAQGKCYVVQSRPQVQIQ